MSRPTCAVIGANDKRDRYSNKSFRAHAASGYDVYAVNPRGGEVEGTPCYKSIADTPVDHFDRVTMYVGPAIGIHLLEEIAAKGCEELWLNPGTSSPELVVKAKALGLNPVEGCSIVDLGRSPSEFN